jgi:hypothetical protein
MFVYFSELCYNDIYDVLLGTRMPTTATCSFFHTWHSAMAYVLGYWFADGNMYSQAACQSYVVSIGSKDLEHLTYLRELIGMGKLTRITGSEVFKLVICRKQAFDDLLRLGGSQRKSLTLQWPTVPDPYLPHLIRGYVDGDGSLSWNRPKNSIMPLIEAVGTQHFVTGMAQAIQERTGIPAPNCNKGKGSIYKVAWYGITAKCLSIWLYKQHGGVALPRKAVLAEEFAYWQPKVFRESRVTPKMWELFGDYLP